MIESNRFAANGVADRVRMATRSALFGLAWHQLDKYAKKLPAGNYFNRRDYTSVSVANFVDCKKVVVEKPADYYDTSVKYTNQFTLNEWDGVLSFLSSNQEYYDSRGMQSGAREFKAAPNGILIAEFGFGEVLDSLKTAVRVARPEHAV